MLCAIGVLASRGMTRSEHHLQAGRFVSVPAQVVVGHPVEHLACIARAAERPNVLTVQIGAPLAGLAVEPDFLRCFHCRASFAIE